MATTRFADWLARQMRTHGYGANQSKLATYLGTASSTVNAWFTRGTIPGPEMCRRIAHLLNVPEIEVLIVAGHMAEEATSADSPELPDYVKALLPSLRLLGEREARVVDDLVQHLLELREPSEHPGGNQG